LIYELLYDLKNKKQSIRKDIKSHLMTSIMYSDLNIEFSFLRLPIKGEDCLPLFEKIMEKYNETYNEKEASHNCIYIGHTEKNGNSYRIQIGSSMCLTSTARTKLKSGADWIFDSVYFFPLYVNCKDVEKEIHEQLKPFHTKNKIEGYDLKVNDAIDKVFEILEELEEKDMI